MIEKGYLYIAQPPLLKIGKGKNEIYLKDEMELNDHLLKRICNQKSVKTSIDEKVLSEHKLYLFVGNLTEYYNVISRLEKRGVNADLIEILIKVGIEEKKSLQDKNKMTYLRDFLIKNKYKVSELFWNEERKVYEILVSKSEAVQTNEIKKIKIGMGLVFSADYQKSLVTGKKILKFDHPPFVVINNKKEII